MITMNDCGYVPGDRSVDDLDPNRAESPLLSPTEPLQPSYNGWSALESWFPETVGGLSDPFTSHNRTLSTADPQTPSPSRRNLIQANVQALIPIEGSETQLYIFRDGGFVPIGDLPDISSATDVVQPQLFQSNPSTGLLFSPGVRDSRHTTPWPENDSIPQAYLPQAQRPLLWRDHGFRDYQTSRDATAAVPVLLPPSPAASETSILTSFVGALLNSSQETRDPFLDDSELPIHGGQPPDGSDMGPPQRHSMSMTTGVNEDRLLQDAHHSLAASSSPAQDPLSILTAQPQLSTEKVQPQARSHEDIDPVRRLSTVRGSAIYRSRTRKSRVHSPQNKKGQRLRIMDNVRSYEHRDENSKVLLAAEYVFGATQRVRPKLDAEAKKSIARAREIGVCNRCKRLKRKCLFGSSPYLPCEACMKAHPLKLHIPCKLQVSLDSLTLFRSGPPEDNPSHPLMFFTHRQNLWEITRDYFAPDVQEVELTQGLGTVLKVSVARFIRHPEDKTAYEWTTPGGPQKMEMPHYCITNIEGAVRNMLDYAVRSRGPYMNKLLNRSDRGLFDTFCFAVQSTSPMVRQALHLWCANRLIEHTWRFCGQEALGMRTISDPTNPWHLMIPVTPIMDQQLDQIVIDSATKTRWFEIYTTIFILLHNCSTQLYMERQFARRYGMSGRYGPVGRYKDAEDQFHTARTLLAYFHYIYHGSVPLSVSNRPRSITSDEKQLEFLTRLRQQISENRKSFLVLREEHRYEADMYWCHQLFFDNWEPGNGHIEELPEDAETNIR